MNAAERIKEQLSNHRIVLYMKGTPIFPQCGFSAKAVSLLNSCLEQDAQKNGDILYVNVLEDPEIREGIKQHGQWPTIPQLYINGELIGGSDILTDLYQSGELADLVKSNNKEK